MPLLTELVIPQGEDWSTWWVIRDPDTQETVDLTDPGFVAFGQIRDDLPEGTTLLHEWSAEEDNVLLGVDGKLTIFVSADVSAEWEWRVARFSVELTYPVDKTLRVDQGRVTLSREITH